MKVSDGERKPDASQVLDHVKSLPLFGSEPAVLLLVRSHDASSQNDILVYPRMRILGALIQQYVFSQPGRRLMFQASKNLRHSKLLPEKDCWWKEGA
jgi:hypothetical protein